MFDPFLVLSHLVFLLVLMFADNVFSLRSAKQGGKGQYVCHSRMWANTNGIDRSNNRLPYSIPWRSLWLAGAGATRKTIVTRISHCPLSGTPDLWLLIQFQSLIMPYLLSGTKYIMPCGRHAPWTIIRNYGFPVCGKYTDISSPPLNGTLRLLNPFSGLRIYPRKSVYRKPAIPTLSVSITDPSFSFGWISLSVGSARGVQTA